MEQEISIDFINNLKATHYFVYKGKQYPFNMKFFKNFSQYFQTHKNLYKNTTEINLLDDSEDKISLNETAINDFINFFYAKKIKLTKENALSLHFLAKKYIVLPLIEATSKFMSIHQKDVVIDLLILNQDDEEISTEEYEEMISKDFPNYFTDSYSNALITLAAQLQFSFHFIKFKTPTTIFLLDFTRNIQHSSISISLTKQLLAVFIIKKVTFSSRYLN